MEHGIKIMAIEGHITFHFPTGNKEEHSWMCKLNRWDRDYYCFLCGSRSRNNMQCFKVIRGLEL